MDYNWETVLLTGCIEPTSKISIWKYWYKWSINVNERLKDYFFSIQYYIMYSDFKNIIFCDNSNYKCLEHISILKELANIYGKNLEVLQFEWDNVKITNTYYGYWEWEIINYALSNSKILWNCKSWYKITGRYIIENINDIIALHKDDKNLFFRLMFPYSFFSLCTALFKVSKEDYNKYLKDINCKLEAWTALESLYYKTLKKTNISVWNLKTIPHRLWRDSRYWEINKFHNVLLKLWLRNYNSKLWILLDYLKIKNE